VSEADDVRAVLVMLGRLEERVNAFMARSEAQTFEQLKAQLDRVNHSLGLLYVEIAAVTGIILGLLAEEIVGPSWILGLLIVGLAATAVAVKRKGVF
jgi:F0F1-type ATP synthase assembly protein I